MPRHLSTVLLLGTLAGSLLAQDPERPTERYNRAIGHYNERRLDEARHELHSLLQDHPRYFPAYGLYWRTLGKVADPDEVTRAVRDAVSIFDEIAIEQRTEDFYYAAMRAHELLDAEQRVARYREEAIERMPRSKIAQQALLRRARNTKDDVAACRMLQQFIDTFEDNVSWCHSAAQQIFRRTSGDPKQFTAAQLCAAATRFDRLSAAFIATYGNPARRVVDLRTIGERLLPIDAELALTYLDEGCAFVRDNAASTDEFDDAAARCYLPLRLLALAKLQRSADARRTAAQLFPDDDPTAPVSLWHGAATDEAELRKVYGDVLHALDDRHAAREQLAYAAHLDEQFAPALQAALERDALPTEQRAELDRKVAAFAAVRTAARKRSLLETMVDRDAPPFALPDLDGNEIELADLRGRVTILTFWATWCGPCLAELAELREYVDDITEGEAPRVVAVSVDSEKAKVRPFVEARRWPFLVLQATGTVERDYDTKSIPQLYVLDTDGRIRFHQSGFHHRHFREHLDWMVKAAR